MLIYAYLFALILGGVLLAASILLGGHGDSDADVDADADAGLDKDLPVLSGHEGDISGVDAFWAFRSIRFWTFFLAFFGLTGLVLDGLGLVGSSLVTALVATGMGAGSGFVAAGLLRWLGRDESGHIASSSDYIGRTVKVLLPVPKHGVGKVRLELRGSSVDVLATTDEEGPITPEEEAIIIEMDGLRARIARLER
jgi:membrane protein implicated in regulation of membrane protease activity